MDKQALKGRMLALEEAELAHAREKYGDFLADARLVTNELHEADEVARAEYAGEMAEAFDQPIHAHTDKLAYLRTLNFGPQTRVAEGAVVHLGARWFVVAVSTARFDFEGQELMGISTAAPIYQAMEGMQVGDIVTFNGRELTISEVL